VQFVLYTEKSIAQCLRELNERMQIKGTKSRPEISGWIEKDGVFSIAVRTPVIARIHRTTHLNARMERDKGITVIRGYVSDGVSPYWTVVLAIVLLLVMAGFVYIDRLIYALLTLLFGLAAYIPMHGDYVNSDILLIEVERTLKASPRPPKR
jgi:type IV secretory pathway VirB3-like protein